MRVKPSNGFQQAAEKGYAEAQFTLGSKYVAGTGVSQNDSEAVKWFSKVSRPGTC